MNEASPDHERSPEAGSAKSRSLLAALNTCFATQTRDPDFPKRLAHLVSALTSSPTAIVFGMGAKGVPQLLASIPSGTPNPVAVSLAEKVFEKPREDGAILLMSQPYLAARVVLQGGGDAAIVIDLPQDGPIVQSLAYERLTLIAALSYRQYRHPDLDGYQNLMAQVGPLVAGDSGKRQEFVDTLAQVCGADYAAIAYFDGHRLKEVTISKPAGYVSRLAPTGALRKEMRDTARNRMRGRDRVFAPFPGQQAGIVIHLHGSKRNQGLLPLASAAFSLHAPPAKRPKVKRGWLALIALAVAVLVGAFIPVQNNVEIPATVEATNRRVLAAPFEGEIEDIMLRDGQTVALGEGPLIRMVTTALDLALDTARSDYSTALIAREVARSANNASDLRSAELEVQTLRERVDLLEQQRDSAEIFAPISGVVYAPDIASQSGQSVQEGEALFEIADLNDLRLSLLVPSSEIERVRSDVVGQFRPDHAPGLRINSTITEIRADGGDDTVVFPGLASLSENTALHPGMRGVLLIEQGTYPAWRAIWQKLRQRHRAN
ncbi:efflux RND transporter periplasmic adaptor subunit [Qingshengfaniella alkalisoli]|uniref:HlyD family efflux transporter periplasmic adaptor subunit n=1 Tax=Qingshengfaniella alkalisoli TaxID=2599296 RepID=A0A5B8I8H0_9RHOB|nr:HlyD family efflux transporter periplasmic adaptor subunit [Qingshengfaniella alkalisoli]QDY70069.1 HlyD family efflux transporter periplasmic adaptor subunit [Qingshengfaniella alkalisoli]